MFLTACSKVYWPATLIHMQSSRACFIQFKALFSRQRNDWSFLFQSYKIQDCITLIWAWSFWDFEKVLFFDSDFIRDRTSSKHTAVIVWKMSNFRSQIKFIHTEKAPKIDTISILVLTLLSNVKAKTDISSNFCALLRKPQLYFLILGLLYEFFFGQRLGS